uniref:Uncharacterized protein n=1 Tax=Sphaerodactylus townsendi TaxID=933632 RepID=A0ACB8FCL7_9SAUR
MRETAEEAHLSWQGRRQIYRLSAGQASLEAGAAVCQDCHPRGPFVGSQPPEQENRAPRRKKPNIQRQQPVVQHDLQMAKRCRKFLKLSVSGRHKNIGSRTARSPQEIQVKLVIEAEQRRRQGERG